MTRPALAHGAVRLEPLAPVHREALRAACAEDALIWDVYSYSMLGDAFDRWWAKAIAGDMFWAICVDGQVVGCSAILPDAATPGVVEIGGTYLAPGQRGGAVNRAAKWLMLTHAFAGGNHRVEFRVDARNGRSQAALLKLGAVREGILRHHKITHTGHIRDTHIFAISNGDWQKLEPGLQPAAP